MQNKENIDNASEALREMKVLRGLEEDSSIEDERERKNDRERRRWAYHNTEVLLKAYRDLVWQAECESCRIAEELEIPVQNLDALLSRVDAEIGMQNKRVELALERAKRYRILVDRVNEALSLLKKKPENGETLFQIINLAYIIPEKLCTSDILYRLGMSSRHYYRLRSQAIQLLSLRLWAAPTPELDAFVELIRIMDKKGA